MNANMKEQSPEDAIFEGQILCGSYILRVLLFSSLCPGTQGHANCLYDGCPKNMQLAK